MSPVRVNSWILNFQSTRELRGFLQQRDEWVRTISWNQFSNIPSRDGVMWHHHQFSEIPENKPLIHDRSRDLRKCIRVQCSGPNPELHSAEMLSSPTQSTELARLAEPLIRCLLPRKFTSLLLPNEYNFCAIIFLDICNTSHFSVFI